MTEPTWEQRVERWLELAATAPDLEEFTRAIGRAQVCAMMAQVEVLKEILTTEGLKR